MIKKKVLKGVRRTSEEEWLKGLVHITYKWLDKTGKGQTCFPSLINCILRSHLEERGREVRRCMHILLLFHHHHPPLPFPFPFPSSHSKFILAQMDFSFPLLLWITQHTDTRHREIHNYMLWIWWPECHD